jgi:hypothetical protein
MTVSSSDRKVFSFLYVRFSEMPSGGLGGWCIMNSGRMSARLLSVAILIVVLRNVSCLHLARIQRGGVFVAVLSHIYHMQQKLPSSVRRSPGTSPAM